MCIQRAGTGLVLLAATGLFGATAAPPRTANVVLVTTDGLRWQEVFTGAEERLLVKDNGVEDPAALRQAFWRDTPEARRAALLPFLWTVVAREGQLYGNLPRGSLARVTNGHNFSYPGYNELLTGAADPRIDSNDKRPNPNVTVLEWLHRRPGYQGRVAAFCSWDVFPFIINRDRSGMTVNAGWDPVPDGGRPDLAMLNRLLADTTPVVTGVRHDSFTIAAAREHLRSERPRVLYLGLGETDDWAHEGRYDRYLEAAHRFDRFVGELWQELQRTDGYRGRTSLVVTTDHGRGDGPSSWKDHGAKVPESQYMWIAVLGPDTPALGERANVQPVTQAQVAATVAALLGEDYAASVPAAAPPIAGTLRIER
jgi:type I phosphodiesterase/nucleotide pyrophosphatase